MAAFTISAATTSSDLHDISTLFTAYAHSLPISLAFQSFSTELASLPGAYSSSRGGALLLARSTITGEAVGCVALRALNASLPSSPPPQPSRGGYGDAGDATRGEREGEVEKNLPRICEIKRLYTVTASRGTGLGKALVAAILQCARDLGYETAKLDTLREMDAARGLYGSFGFVECAKYYETPLEDRTVFLELRL